MQLTKLGRFELFAQESVGSRAFLASLLNGTSAFCSRVLHQSLQSTRGGVLKFTSVVDNDTTMHDVHTYTVAFSPSVLIKSSICPYHQTLSANSVNGSRKRFTVYDTQSYYFIRFLFCFPVSPPFLVVFPVSCFLVFPVSWFRFPLFPCSSSTLSQGVICCERLSTVASPWQHAWVILVLVQSRRVMCWRERCFRCGEWRLSARIHTSSRKRKDGSQRA